MEGNATVRRYSFAAVAPGAVGAAGDVLVSEVVASGGLVVGSPCVVSPRAVIGTCVTVYAYVIDATHIGLVFVNGSAAGVTPAAATYDVIVFTPTGALST
jgi:hypothetical protein